MIQSIIIWIIGVISTVSGVQFFVPMKVLSGDRLFSETFSGETSGDVSVNYDLLITNSIPSWASGVKVKGLVRSQGEGNIYARVYNSLYSFATKSVDPDLDGNTDFNNMKFFISRDLMTGQLEPTNIKYEVTEDGQVHTHGIIYGFTIG